MIAAWPKSSVASEVSDLIAARSYSASVRVQPVALERLVAERLDRLVVEQAVDRLGADLVVGRVHLAPDPDPPLRGREGEGGIGADRDEGDRRERPGIFVEQDADHEPELEQRRADVEQDDAEQEADRLDAALGDPRKLARPPLQVVAQREAEQVLEHLERDPASGPLGDLGEDRVAQLAEAGRGQPGEAVGEQGGDRQGDQRSFGTAQAVDHRLEEERHLDGDQLGRHQEREGDDHPQAQLQALARPKEGHDDGLDARPVDPSIPTRGHQGANRRHSSRARSGKRGIAGAVPWSELGAIRPYVGGPAPLPRRSDGSRRGPLRTQSVTGPCPDRFRGGPTVVPEVEAAPPPGARG